MPSNMLSADTGFPQFVEGQSTNDKLNAIVNYLYMLLEQLRYSMNNLDQDNFNATGLEEIGKLITDPVYAQLQNDEGSIAALALTAKGLALRITDAEGNISTLTQTANSLMSRITDAEGNVSTLQQTAQSLTSRISGAEGNVSTLTQTVNGMRLSVTNGESSSTIALMANGVSISSQSITFTGAVTFADLSTAGRTTITGDNITTGTITAINISGCTITGSTFRSLLEGDGSVGGEIQMYYIDFSSSLLAGGIRLDDQGAGTTEEAKYRMFLYTNNVLGVAFALKIQSAGDCSIASDKSVYINAGTSITVTAPKIYLVGSVYVNDVLLT